VRIVNEDRWNALSPEQLALGSIPGVVMSFQAGNIAARSVVVPPARLDHLGPTDRARFNVFFAARNGSWTQLLRFHRISADRCKVVRNEGQPNAVVLLEEIPEGYPRNAQGQVDW
jgi:hypothetical protein